MTLIPLQMCAELARARARVLVVDDEPDVRRAVQLMLEDEGYTVVTASDGPRALALIGIQPPDVVLLDLLMPGMDGWELQARLQALGLQVPVVLMTADHDAVLDAPGGRAAVAGFLPKPFSLQALVAVMARVARPAEG